MRLPVIGTTAVIIYPVRRTSGNIGFRTPQNLIAIPYPKVGLFFCQEIIFTMKQSFDLYNVILVKTVGLGCAV